MPASNSSTSTLKRYLAEVLERIVFPEVEFRQSTLRDAVEFLRVEGSRLAAEDSAGLTLNAPPVLLLISENAPPIDLRLTLRMENVPFGEAVRVVANMAGLDMRVNHSGVCLCWPEMAEAIDREMLYTAPLPVVYLPEAQGPTGWALN